MGKVNVLLAVGRNVGQFIRPEKMEELLKMNITVYAMIPDLQARGIALENIHDKVKPIGYDDLIDILDVTPKIISWM